MSDNVGAVKLQGDLSVVLIKGRVRAPLSWRLRNMLRWSFIFGWLANRGARFFTFLTGIPTLTAELHIVKIDGKTGQRIDYGLVSSRVVTTAFVNFLVDQFQADTTEVGDFKYHDSGVGTTAEAIGDTGIETTDGENRVAGTQVESAANAYRSVGTIPYTTTKAITEHGLFSQNAGGTLMDRSVFSAVNVVNGDSIQFTYTLTVTAGN